MKENKGKKERNSEDMIKTGRGGRKKKRGSGEGR